MKTTTTPLAAPAPPPIPLSIRVLRRLQPLVEGLLSSPLHGLLSRDVLLLTYRGRRTGQPHRLPLSYVELGDHLYLCTRAGGARWWRNLGDGRPVELRLRGRRHRAATTVLDPASSEARAGLRAFLTRNPRTAEMLYQVHCDDQRRPLEADIEREVAHSVVVRLQLSAG